MQKGLIMSVLAICIITALGLFVISDTEQVKHPHTNSSISSLPPSSSVSDELDTSNEPSVTSTYDLKLMESLDDGSLWPKQRRKMRKSYVDEMLKRVHSFPSARAKHQQIKELIERVEILERKTNGKRQ